MAEKTEQPGTKGARTWNIDPAHTVVEFSVKHMMIATVRGNFGEVEGQIRLDDADPSRSFVEARINTASIDTRQAQRDEHLRSADFFDVANHPTMEYRSRKVEQVSKGHFKVTGDLTIRGTTHEVVLDVTEGGRVKDPWGADRIAFSAEGKIDRREFGLMWNQALEAGGMVVSNEVKISIEAQAVAETPGGAVARADQAPRRRVSSTSRRSWKSCQADRAHCGLRSRKAGW
jgi:polyisoprenoid-binding protein YceI